MVGPTASGKTEASIGIAQSLGAEILCVDSMLVYRGMDVGTAKPSSEQRARVPHHLVDAADPGEPFSVARYQALARAAVREIADRGNRALLVGGGGLYYRSIVDGLEFPGTEPLVRDLLAAEGAVLGAKAMHTRLSSFDVSAARRIDPANVRRTVRALEVAAITGRPFSSFAQAWDRYPEGAVRAAGIEMDRPALHRRIERRVVAMLPGLLEETRSLLDRGFGPFLTASQAIGYAEAVACLEGLIGQEEATARTVRRTKALARRQLAWFRRDRRIRWFPVGEEGAPSAMEEIVQYLRGSRSQSRRPEMAAAEVS
jgi:tRNA dimethylallyltransferase